MTKAQFIQTIARLTAGYPIRSQAHDENPLIVAKIFDIV